MADEWQELLFSASYDGVLFDVVSTSDEVSRVLARHEYPFRDGAVLQDMGGAPRETRCEIVFIPTSEQTDNHLERFKAFKNLLDAAHGADLAPVLVHPLTGAYRALPENIQFQGNANERDQVSLSVTFVESGLDAAAFTTTADQSVASGVVATEGAATGLADALADVDGDTVIAAELAAEPVTVGDTALTVVSAWENNESLTPRQVNLELNAITNEITRDALRLQVASDVRRYPTYLALQRLHAAVRFAAELAIETAPKLFEHTVERTEPLLAIMTDVYGGSGAVDRYARARELNDIPNPSRVLAGTLLSLEQP